MFARLAHTVTRRWTLIVLGWTFAVVVTRFVAPAWQDIINDGDFAYLPPGLPSVIGERWMSEAFPWQRGKSQIVLAVAREGTPMTNDDVQVGYDLVRRMKNIFGAARLAEAQRLADAESALRRAGQTVAADEARDRRLATLQQADEALHDALELDTKLADYWDERVAADKGLEPLRPRRLAEIYHNRALLARRQGDLDAARAEATNAVQLDPSLQNAGDEVRPAAAAQLPLVDVWSWRDSYFGSKLVSQDNHVRLAVLQLSNEFMAVDNIQVLETIESELRPVRESLLQQTQSGLTILQSGSAAVGADLLRSAAASIRNTEAVTVVMVILFLSLVYRSPLLVAVPLVTILVSLLVSTGLVALLTQLTSVPGFSWWTLKVFSTTKIFIVVILFGAGTDFCLFLIARYKEELRGGLDHPAAVRAALTHVGGALTASALTTILGLGMMFFADFGKFRFSGPVIGLCLAITWLTCVTLTPALMCGLGPYLFWPFGRDVRPGELASASGPQSTAGGFDRISSAFWHSLARIVVTRPGLVLTVAILALLPLASYGALHGNDVTYDFLSGLPSRCPSRQGAEVLRRHFPVGESGPVTVLVRRDNAQFETPAGRDHIRDLSDDLHLPGVVVVRSAEDPLGEYEPGEKPGIRQRSRTHAPRAASSPAYEIDLRGADARIGGERGPLRVSPRVRPVLAAGHSRRGSSPGDARRADTGSGLVLAPGSVCPDRHHGRHPRFAQCDATRQREDPGSRCAGGVRRAPASAAAPGRLSVYDADRALQLLRHDGSHQPGVHGRLWCIVPGPGLESPLVPVCHPGRGGTGLQRVSGHTGFRRTGTDRAIRGSAPSRGANGGNRHQLRRDHGRHVHFHDQCGLADRAAR